MRAVLLVFCLLLVAVTALPGAFVPAQAQEPAAPAADPAAQVAPAFPGPLEVTARSRAISDTAALAEREIARLASFDALAADVAAAAERQAGLEALFATLVAQEYARPERTVRVRDQALAEEQRLEALRERVLTRSGQLGELRAAWVERQRFWSAWRDTLRGTPEFAMLQPEMREALARIDAVLAQVAEVVPALLSVEREIESLLGQTRQVAERVAAIRAGRREALLRRDQPVLLGPAFLDQLRTQPWGEWSPIPSAPAGLAAAFLREHGGLLVLHLALALILGLVAMRLKALARPEDAWWGMLRHPWAVGVFAATTLVARRYGLAPPLWDVAIWTLLAGSGAVTASRLLGSRRLRLMVYLLAGTYPLLLWLEAARAPVPLFRLGLAALAVAAVVALALLARAAARAPAEPRSTQWILAVGAAVWGVVFVAEAVGFYLLARWIVHATLTSALLIYVVAFLVVLGRGAIQALLRLEATERWSFLRRFGVPFAERLVVLLQAALVFLLVLMLLDVWELTASPLESWRWLAAAGITVAGVEITLGRVVVAALMIYLALQVSWLVRSFMATEAQRRWELDRGVGDSITTLLHYLLITAGFFLALGALGVRLQNFAIVAGALGVGIGFGLQNVVNNFVSGLILLFERPVRVGDTVVVGGEWGTIKKIGLRSTVVATFDRSEMIVPNGDLISEKVTNWTLSTSEARLVLAVGAGYGSDVERVLEILREVGGSHPDVLADPPPQALFMEFGDSSLDFELRVWVADLRLRLEVRSALLTAIDRRFRDEGIEIPFPQRDLHLRSIDPHLAAALGPVVQRGDRSEPREPAEAPERAALGAREDGG